jgi:hypothetical protein
VGMPCEAQSISTTTFPWRLSIFLSSKARLRPWS